MFYYLLSSMNTIQRQRTMSSAGGPLKNRGSQGVYVRQHNETTFTTSPLTRFNESFRFFNHSPRSGGHSEVQ